MPVIVRVNGLNTGLTADDLEAIVTAGLGAVVIPKLERVEEVLKVDAWIALYERKVGLSIGTVADAERAGRAAVSYDGMMVDYAHTRNALDLLRQAEAFGIEVGEYPQVKALEEGA